HTASEIFRCAGRRALRLGLGARALVGSNRHRGAGAHVFRLRTYVLRQRPWACGGTGEWLLRRADYESPDLAATIRSELLQKERSESRNRFRAVRGRYRSGLVLITQPYIRALH